MACSMTGGTDGRIGVLVWTWNLGRLSGKGDVCEMRMIDVCRLQEVRWSRLGARMLGMNGKRYRPWWSRNGNGVGGVGDMVMDELCETAVEVRVGNRVMSVIVVFEEDVLRLICGYDQQSARNLKEKQTFYDLKG